MKNYKKSACAVALFSALFVSAHSADAGNWWGEEQTFSDIPYNLAIQFSVHNTYDKKDVYGIGENDGFYGFLDQQIASLEIDFIAEKVDGVTQFNVGHGWGDLQNGTICEETSGNKSPLANCLSDVKRWIDDNNPDYPITLFLDLKNSGDYDSSTYQELEQVFTQSLGDVTLFSPPALMVSTDKVYSSPRERVEKVGWPTMAQMAGKVIVFIATNNDRLVRYAQGAYHDNKWENAKFFVVPTPCESGESDINSTGCNFSRFPGQVVAVNQKHQYSTAKAMGSRALSNGFVLRNWDTDDDCDSSREDLSYNDFQSAVNEFFATHYGADPRRGQRSNNYPTTCGVPLLKDHQLLPGQTTELALGTRMVSSLSQELAAISDDDSVSHYFQIKSVEQGLCLNEANISVGELISMRDCSDNNTRFRIEKVIGGRHWQTSGGTLMLEVMLKDDGNSNLRMEAESYSAGRPVKWGTLPKPEAQMNWYLAKMPGGNYRILSKYNGLCLRAHYDDYVKIDACNGHVSSEWQISAW
ncbi:MULTISPECIES: Ca2+-dependent phosphoinositide-specific phospholipase C [unclassified Pseudoalteromonas]|uniref:Ca2+-dependent phosphoinositide-specific phospholipase C n=1 Tax=unclassified Pseudoalteromonas TaxID=194690 RepID=UPI002097901C|nr:Ca2+-dependent phosphoinositide-specific phospholipase C [Pseudoalteromonas sp. XMcav2-N]MCO7187861.1 Ca2+-dependent phosphoinositide-specific phospholipase C [Pseudoalteromonas sp. XMcav2-N]